ncbi:MAG: flippase [Thermoplasmata archaeon]|nr:flippase [Thermoplasmata archaeon]
MGSTPPVAAETSGARFDRTIQSVGRGTAVMVVATIVLVVAQFLTRVIVTRNVSADQWGEFNLGLALANLLALVAAFGIPTATARSLAFEETYEARVALIRKALWVSLPIAAASSILVYLFAAQLASPFQGGNLTPVFQLFALSISLTMLSNVIVGIFQGLERAEPNAIFVQILNPVLFLVFTGGFILAGWGFHGVIWGYVLSWVVAFAALAVYTFRRLPLLLRRLSGKAFTGDASARVGFMALTVTLFGVATLSYLTSYADTLLLGVFRPTDIVGNYSSAMNLTRLLLVGTGTVTFIYLPVSSRLRRERDFEGLKQTYVTVTRWMALLTLPLTFLFVFDPAYSLAFTFGANQVNGAAALQLLVVSNTISILLGPSTATLGGLGEVRTVLRYTAYSTVANFVLCFALIPTYGMIGAAIAWSVARLLFPGLALIRIYRVHGINPFAAHFVRPLLLSTAILVPIYYFLPVHPSILLVFGLVALPFVVFAGAILVTYSVDRGDVFFAKAAERRFAFVRPIRRLLESRLAVEGQAPVVGGPSG